MKKKANHHRILIIGAGFAGLGAAIRLRESGETDLLILERADDVGGCWRDNRYPGLQCDVQSVVYSFSFAPNPSWSRAFPLGEEIRAYLRGVADDFGLRPHIRFGTEVLDLRWSEDDQLWWVETSRGTHTAEILLSAHGALSEPAIPELPGLDRFEGPVFHSARWDESVSLAGKRVSVIGTGASAIQIIPAIQAEVGELCVYQRTPAWVLPRPDHALPSALRQAYASVPGLQKLARGLRFAQLESRALGTSTWPKLLELAERGARAHLARQVADPELRQALTPSDRLGCKRVLLSSEFYPAMSAANVELVSEGIEEIREHAIVGADGRERETDAIVMCTGFRVSNHPMSRRIRGRDGRSLAEHWSDQGARAYLGMSIPEFPNFFLLATGPHCGLGHNSIVYMIEAQLAYVCAALAEQRERGKPVVEVREEAVERFTREMRERLEGGVWSSGCSSYYLDDAQRNIALWPGFALGYRMRTRRFDPEAYTFAQRGAA